MQAIFHSQSLCDCCRSGTLADFEAVLLGVLRRRWPGRSVPDQLWRAVAPKTRTNYARALKRWLVFAFERNVTDACPPPEAVNMFVEKLQATQGSAAIRGTLAGITSMYKMFDLEWQSSMVVGQLLKGIKNCEAVP